METSCCEVNASSALHFVRYETQRSYRPFLLHGTHVPSHTRRLHFCNDALLQRVLAPLLPAGLQPACALHVCTEAGTVDRSNRYSDAACIRAKTFAPGSAHTG